MWGLPKLGIPLWGPYNNQYGIKGSAFGFPSFWETTIFASAYIYICICMYLIVYLHPCQPEPLIPTNLRIAKTGAS